MGKGMLKGWLGLGGRGGECGQESRPVARGGGGGQEGHLPFPPPPPPPKWPNPTRSQDNPRVIIKGPKI